MEEFVVARRRLQTPMLVVAEMRAEFSVVQQLRYAERYLLRYSGLAHDDFLAHNVLRARINSADQAHSALVQTSYRDLCRSLRLFLDATLGGDSEAQSTLQAQVRERQVGGADVDMTYTSADRPPPGIKDLTARLATEDAASAIAWCKEQVKTERPLFAMGDLNTIGYELIDQGRGEDAVAIFTYMTELYPNRSMTWDSLAEGYLAVNDKGNAIATYEQALTLLPNDQSISPSEREENAQEMAATIARLKDSPPMDSG